jgi:hypothetical protein
MHNTGNPLGSKDILDLYDNSETIDNFVNSQQDETPDRFGQKRLTLAGLIRRSMALRNEINDFSGALTFRPEWSDVPMNVSEGVGGEGGALNLQAEALGNRSEINKVTSREALRRSYAEAGYNLVSGSFEAGGTLVNANDVLIHEASGKAFSGPAGVVDAGTDPTLPSSVYVSRTDAVLRGELVTGAMATRGATLSLRDFVSVKDFGAIGDGLSHPLSSIFSTLSAAQSVYPIATSLTQEIDFIAGQTANNYCYAKGGGAVYWPAGHYIGSGYDSITLRSFVSNFGEGYASFLDFNWNAMKTEGVWGGAVTGADWKNISTISGRLITLSTSSDASVFSAYVDKLVMLRSASMDAEYHTSFYETVKVKSVNTITGVVELYDTIKDAVVSPQLAVSSYDLVQCVEIYGLRLRSSQPTVNMPFYVDGIYKSHIHDLWLEGAHGLAWNAITKCSVHDIFCTVYAGSTNYDNLAIEIKYGSYDSSFDRIFVDIINTDSTTALMLMISIGERSRDIRINGVTINASDCNANLYGQHRAVRTNVKNVTAYLNNSRRVLSVSQSSGGGSLNSNSNFSDFEVYVFGVFGAGVIFDGGAATESDIHAKRIHIYGQQGLYGGKDYGSIYFGNVTDRCSVENADIQGKYTDYGSNNSVIECSYSGPANTTTRLKQSSKRCTTKYGAFVAQTKTIATNLYPDTTANYVVSTIPIVVGFPYIAGDRFSLRARGFIFGAAGAKTLLITSTDGDFFSSTIAAGTNAAFILDVDAIILSANTTSISLRMSGSLTVGSTITPVDYLRNITTTSAKTLMFEAWKAASADTLAVYRSEISFIENGE